MDHGGHSMPTGPKCSMFMLWNTNIIDTCIVFRSWHISSVSSFVISFFAIVALGVFYEYLRAFQTTIDRRIAASLAGVAAKGKGRELGRPASRNGNGSRSSTPEQDVEDSGLLTGRRVLKPTSVGVPIPPISRAIRALLYGATVFLSFFLMLVFMTYNAYLIGAVVIGAAIGNYVFSSHMDVDAVLAGTGGGKGMACH